MVTHRSSSLNRPLTSLTSVPTADFASVLVFELRRGSLPDDRDFLRFKFKNGTDRDFNNIALRYLFCLVSWWTRDSGLPFLSGCHNRL